MRRIVALFVLMCVVSRSGVLLGQVTAGSLGHANAVRDTEELNDRMREAQRKAAELRLKESVPVTGEESRKWSAARGRALPNGQRILNATLTRLYLKDAESWVFLTFKIKGKEWTRDASVLHLSERDQKYVSGVLEKMKNKEPAAKSQ